MSANPVEIVARYERLQAERATFEDHWEQIRRIMYPDGAPFLSREVPGTKAYQDVYDSTGVQAAEVFAAGMEHLLTNASVRWLNLRALDDALNRDEEIALWFEHATDALYNIYNSPNSNFGVAQHEKYQEVGPFGSAFTFAEDRPGNVPLFRTFPLGSTLFAENHEGRVDTVYRKFTWTARQAFQKWGAAAGDKVAKAATDAKKQDESFEFIHAIYPRAGYDPNRRNRTNLPFASCWVNVTEKALADEGGFHEFPGAAPRWLKRAGEVYGRGPGMKVLADVKMLQRGMKAVIRGVEKVMSPPLLVADDGVVSPVRTSDNGITYARADMMMSGRDPVKFLQTGARPDMGDEFLDKVRARIDSGFYVHLFQFARDPNMTATQYLGILEQVRSLLNPVLSRMYVEDLNPTVVRTLGIAMRAGLVAPPPRRLVGAEYRVEYVSPVAKSQRIGEARAVAQTVEILAPIVEADPTALDNFDTDAITRAVADTVGMRKSWLRPVEQRDQMRKARAEVAAKREERQAMLDAAEIAKKGGNAAKSLASARPQAAA